MFASAELFFALLCLSVCVTTTAVTSRKAQLNVDGPANEVESTLHRRPIEYQY